MSLVVENGQGVNNADAYISVSICDNYHLSLGNVEWEIKVAPEDNTQEREEAIKKATAFIDARYGGRFKGRKKTSTQALLFPRVNIKDSDGYVLDGVPSQIIKATCEASLKFFKGEDLMPDLDRGGQVISETVGPISVSYSAGALSATKYDMIESLLRGCLQNDGTLKMIRA